MTSPISAAPLDARKTRWRGVVGAACFLPVYHHAPWRFVRPEGFDHALISIGVDIRSTPALEYLDQLPLQFVRIVAPDEGSEGYCDLDFAYAAVLASHHRQAARVFPDGRIAGSVAAPAPDCQPARRAARRAEILLGGTETQSVPTSHSRQAPAGALTIRS
ncbi:hypothetical protein [Rhodococcus opacus]|nr:hypothetical protein [Rhodococcus opacus]